MPNSKTSCASCCQPLLRPHHRSTRRRFQHLRPTLLRHLRHLHLHACPTRGKRATRIAAGSKCLGARRTMDVPLSLVCGIMPPKGVRRSPLARQISVHRLAARQPNVTGPCVLTWASPRTIPSRTQPMALASTQAQPATLVRTHGPRWCLAPGARKTSTSVPGGAPSSAVVLVSEGIREQTLSPFSACSTPPRTCTRVL